MGLQDDMKRRNSVDDAAKAAELQRLETTYRIASQVWADFLAYCKEFAELAPRRGIVPGTGQKVLSQHRRKDVGNWDEVLEYPGGWVFNFGGRFFAIMPDGSLLVETKKPDKRPALFPKRTRNIHRFEPCPPFPASAAVIADLSDDSVMPGVFRLTRPPVYPTQSEVVQQDFARFGGALTVYTHQIEFDAMKLIFAKDLILDVLSSAP